MKKQAIWISVIIIGIAGLIFASQVMAPDPIDFPEKDQETTEETTIPEVTEPETETKTEVKTLPEGWQKIERENYSINTPSTWNYSEPTNMGDGVENFKTVAEFKSGVSDDAYTDPDIVTLDISYIKKGERIFEEIIDAFAMDEEAAAASIEFMQENASEPYNEITIEDIVVERETVELNDGTVAERISFQCLKHCYIEGPAFTNIQYFIENEETVFELEARTATSEKTETLVLVAEQVVKTFEVK